MADVYMKSKFYFKRGKAASWAEKNVLLGPGEPGFEIDTGRLKVGDGIRTWNNLPYLAENEIKNEINKYFSDVYGKEIQSQNDIKSLFLFKFHSKVNI